MDFELDRAFQSDSTSTTLNTSTSWTMEQEWSNLCFLHYAIDPNILRERIPAGMELDTYEGQAYLSIVPFHMKKIRLREMPSLLSMRFGELNLRTYVTYEGRPGVYFYSIDADSWLGGQLAQLMYHLPYYDADISLVENENQFEFHSVRHGRGPVGEFSCLYRPISEVFEAQAGTLDAWLTQRYSLFSTDSVGRIYRGDIEHGSWQLQRAEATIPCNTLFEAVGLPRPLEEPRAFYVADIVTHCWPLKRL